LQQKLGLSAAKQNQNLLLFIAGLFAVACSSSGSSVEANEANKHYQASRHSLIGTSIK
jgi:hypothetical protein